MATEIQVHAASLAPAVTESAGRPDDPLDNTVRQNVIDKVTKLKSATPILNAP